MTIIPRMAAAALAFSALVGLDAAAAYAAGRYDRGTGPGYVVAESHWGHGTISGPVRRGPVGWQVRMPGGSWIDCGRSCSQTLRQQTIDFWESNGTQAKDSGPNYFRWSFGF